MHCHDFLAQWSAHGKIRENKTTNEAPMTEVAGKAGFLIPRRPFDDTAYWAGNAAQVIQNIMTLSAHERRKIVDAFLKNVKKFNAEDALNQIELIYTKIAASYDHYLLNYNPIIEADWADPVVQLQRILKNPEHWQHLIEKNYNTVCNMFHHKNAVAQIDTLIKKQFIH
ncbi:hypothetical protein [Pedobacter sp.]|uniref:hypothetical protein n=1 Tax=Pedobacter sp. TaxID=1411316 RepID=UPI003D7FD60E